MSTTILDRIRKKISAPLALTLPFDKQFADYPFDPEVCWIWTGGYSTGKRGADRPVIQLAGRGTPMRNVARVMLCLKDGTPVDERIPYHAAHACDNPPCVNPWHLEWKTDGDNKREQRQRVRTTAEIIASLGSL